VVFFLAIKITGFAGSLRQGSFNRKLLRVAAAACKDAGVEFEEIDLSGVPLYNFDVEQKGFPPAVQKLRYAITEADGVIIATPEYNHSFSCVTKNAIDWASRAPNIFAGKRVAILGASNGGFGTVRAQIALRPVLASLDAFALPAPQVHGAFADAAFDENGALNDVKARDSVSKLVSRLIGEIGKSKGLC
jgi:chromate reductase, NAD(P)H dehydrogenase (quinone)